MVNIPKFAATLRAAPAFLLTMFTEREFVNEAGERRGEASLAARYAAKEALAKALGLPSGGQWLECEVLTGSNGEPHLVTRGELAAAQRRKGIDSWHLSMSTEGDMAVAYVVGEARQVA